MSESKNNPGQPLREDLQNWGDNRFLLIPPGGNLGDILIYRGFIKLANEIGIEYTDFRDTYLKSDFLERNLRGVPFDSSITEPLMLGHDIIAHALYQYHRILDDPDVVYIHGGGHFNDLWGIGVEALRIVDAYFDCRIIVGPSSCKFEESNPTSFMRSIDNDVVFYCREKYSYKIMEEIQTGIDNFELKMTDDTALYLSPEDFNIENIDREYTLLALRGDKESVVSSGAIQCDSNVGNVVQKDVSVECSDIDNFASEIANAVKIHTDRLHVALTASIFDVPTIFYGNSYHKNKGVYEYSLSDHSGIKFVNIG